MKTEMLPIPGRSVAPAIMDNASEASLFYCVVPSSGAQAQGGAPRLCLVKVTGDHLSLIPSNFKHKR